MKKHPVLYSVFTIFILCILVRVLYDIPTFADKLVPRTEKLSYAMQQVTYFGFGLFFLSIMILLLWGFNIRKDAPYE